MIDKDIYTRKHASNELRPSGLFNSIRYGVGASITRSHIRALSPLLVPSRPGFDSRYRNFLLSCLKQLEQERESAVVAAAKFYAVGGA